MVVRRLGSIHTTFFNSSRDIHRWGKTATPQSFYWAVLRSSLSRFVLCWRKWFEAERPAATSLEWGTTLTNSAATSFRVCARAFAGIFSTSILVLTGCGVGPVGPASATDAVSVSLGGHVHGGQQPVTQSYIALYATASAGAGPTAYGAAVAPIATTSTDANGEFVIPSGYTCPSTQQAYIVATGGNPGTTDGTDNSAIVLVAALGSCNNLTPATTIDINEVTTVAAAYALSGFLPAGGAGITEAAIKAGSANGVTTSAANTQGLSDAFANANNIVNTTTGLAYTAPPSNSTGVVPQSTIHALADILQACVNTTGPTQSGCTSLFSATTPPTGSGISAPANVFQAALDIAAYPGNNVSTLYGMINASPAFPYTMTTAPNDWSIGITYNYPAAVLTSGLGMGVDKYDNVYITGSTGATAAGSSTELLLMSPQGALLSSSLMSSIATSNNARWISFDANNNAYVANGNAANVYKFAPTTPSNPSAGGTVTTLSYTTVSGTKNNYAVAVDQFGDVWTEGYKSSTCSGTPITSNTLSCSLIEFPVSAQTTPVASFPTLQDVQPGVGGARGVAFDTKTGNIWATDINNSNLTLFNVTPSATAAATASGTSSSIVLSSAASATPGTGSQGVAIDANGNAWVTVIGTGLVTTTVPAALYKVSPALASTLIAPPTTGGLEVPGYDVIDGAGNVFIANNNATSAGTGRVGAIMEYSPSFNSNAGAWVSPGYGYSPTSVSTGAGVGATGTAAITSGAVTSIALGVGGTGYVNAPGVVITAGGGTGATATAIVSGGVVTGFTVTNGGSGYTSAPTVTVATLYGGPVYEPAYLAVDKSGALWTLSSGSNGPTSIANLVQILGVAAPTDPIQADGNYGVKP